MHYETISETVVFQDWQYAVANGDTLRGFSEWVEEEYSRDS